MATSGDGGGVEQSRELIRLEDIRTMADTATFFDACLSGDKGWTEAVGRHSTFRIPGFGDKYQGLREELIELAGSKIQNEKDFENAFLKEANEVAAALYAQAPPRRKWSDSTYGPGQIPIAQRGHLMRLDKAVITVLAFNRMATEFGLQGKWAFGRHAISACLFYFANLQGRLARMAEAAGDASEAGVTNVMTELAEAVGQPLHLIRELAGKMPEGEGIGPFEAAATHLASFPTHYAIYCFVAKRQTDLKRLNADVIVRRRAHGKRMDARNDELIERAARITHGPYQWPGGAPNGHWPPKGCAGPEAPAS